MATAGIPLWSTTAASNATADPTVNMAEGMAPSAVNDGVRALMASVAKWRDDLYGITAAGTATAFTITTGSTFATAGAMSGVVFSFIPNVTSGAAPTLAVDGLTARAINISTGVAIPSGALLAGTPYLVKYVHATTEFILLGSPATLSTLDIIGGTQLTAIATDDSLPIYDLSATSNKRILISDALKVVNLLTSDSSPDGAADYVMTYDASASAAKKVLLASLPSNLPRGYIDGCILSNGTDTTNDINIAAGVCRDSTNTQDIIVPALSGKQLDANWAAGATAGMRNSAAGIADRTYHIYAVRTAASTTADIYAHTSTTVATVLTALQAEPGGADYIYARRIGSIVRVTAIVPFTQVGDYFRFKTPTMDIATTGLSTSSTSFALASVPLGLSLEVDLNLSITHASNAAKVYLRNPNDTDSAASGTVAPLAQISADVAPNTSNGMVKIWTDTSAQIAAISTNANTTLRGAPLGYRDRRGKDS